MPDQERLDGSDEGGLSRSKLFGWDLANTLWRRLRATATGILHTAPRAPGASEVKQIRVVVGATSVNRATVLDPSSGTKARIIAVFITSSDGTVSTFEVYFHTGANIGTTPAKAIYETVLDLVDHPADGVVFPDGAGPVGDADEVVSWRTGTEIGATAAIVLVYREE